jgi:hypothetical protein
MYRLNDSIIHWDDNGTTRWIPLDEANTDYQQYLAWIAEGNEPEVIAP